MWYPKPPELLKARAIYPYSVGLYELFLRKSRFGDTIALGEKVGDKLHVPRGLVQPPPPESDKRSKGSYITFPGLVGPKNEQQAQIISESLALLREGRSHIIQAGTGTGKTYMALHLAAKLRHTTLIVVTKSTMMDQWRNECKRFLGLEDHQIGTLRQKKCDVAGKPIVIAMLHSLAKDHYPDWVKEYFGLVVFDECHRLSSDHFMTVAGMYNSYLRLGLSATPKRSDGREFIFHAHIGPVMVKSEATLLKYKVLVAKSGTPTPLQKVIENGIIVKRPLALSPGRTGHINKILAKSSGRNSLIVRFVSKAHGKGRRTVVFSDLIEGHLLPLRTLLVKEGVPLEDIGLFCGTLYSGKELDDQKHRKVVLTTYSMCAEAVDVPRWDTAVLAMPKSRIVQIVGRILREHEDKSFPVVLDILDEKFPLFVKYFNSRRRQYAEGGAEVVMLE